MADQPHTCNLPEPPMYSVERAVNAGEYAYVMRGREIVSNVWRADMELANQVARLIADALNLHAQLPVTKDGKAKHRGDLVYDRQGNAYLVELYTDFSFDAQGRPTAAIDRWFACKLGDRAAQGFGTKHEVSDLYSTTEAAKAAAANTIGGAA